MTGLVAIRLSWMHYLIVLCLYPALFFSAGTKRPNAWMGTFALNEVAIDQRHDPSAQHLIVCLVICLKNLEPHCESRVADQNSRILLVAVSSALQEPALVRIWVFWSEARIQALDKISGERIVDLRAIVFAKDDPGLALRIPDDVLSIPSRAGDEEGPV